MDLIVGSRAETLVDVQHTLDDLLGLESPPPHISCYALTPEPGTPLGEDPHVTPTRTTPPTPTTWWVECSTSTVTSGRRSPTGPSPDTSAVTTTSTGIRATTVGFGSAAHSHQHGRRFWNVRTPDRYIAMVNADEQPLGGEEVLDDSTKLFERDSLALRTSRGVPVEAFDSLDEIAHLVRVSEGRVTLAPEGRLLANQVIVRLKSST
jgi:coproporphyrinogen III oxidase-like Fe-S oxidoreductase